MMKKWTALLLCALMMAVSAAGMAEGQGTLITVQGNASVNAQPDIVTITANAGVTGSSMLEAQELVSGIIALTVIPSYTSAGICLRCPMA